MALVINSNIQSLSSQNSLNKAQDAKETAMDRLSSGKRINSAADDAAGLAISTKMTSQIKGLNQAMRNANDGISMIQTAEGALDQSQNILQRMRELAVQSSNGTYTEGNRDTMNAEVEQLKAELDRIGETTAFNGTKLFDTENKKMNLQIGDQAGQNLTVGLDKVSTETLGSAETAGVSAQGTNSAIKVGDLRINDIDIDPSKASDDKWTQDATSAMSKVAAINSHTEETGVKAVVNENSVSGSTMSGAAATGTFELNGVTINIATSSDKESTREAVRTAINAVSGQTGITVDEGGSDEQGLTLVAKDGQNVTLGFSGGVNAADVGLAAAGTYQGGFTLVATTADEIRLGGGDGTNTGDIANAGLKAGTYSVNESAVSATAKVQTGLSGAGSSATTFTFKEGAATAAITGEDLTLSDSAGGSKTLSAPVTAKDIAAGFNDASMNVTARATTTLQVTDLVIETGKVFKIEGAGNSAVTFTADDVADVDKALEKIAASLGDSEFSIEKVGEATGSKLSFQITDNTGDTIKIETNDATAAGKAHSLDQNGNVIGAAAGVSAATNTLAFGYVEITGVDDPDVTTVSLNSDVAAATSTIYATRLQTVNIEDASTNAIEDGDLLINGKAIGASKASDDHVSFTAADSSDGAASAIAQMEAINRESDSTGVTATTNETVVHGTGASTASAATDATVGAEGRVHINGVDIGPLTLAQDANAATGTVDVQAARDATIAAINDKSAQTGVTAEDNGTSITLKAEDGRNVSVAIESLDNKFGAAVGLDTDVDGIGAAAERSDKGQSLASDYETTYGTVTLHGPGKIDIATTSEGTNGAEEAGFKVGSYGGAETGTFLKDINIQTVDGANAAIKSIDNALDQLSAQRSDLGAVQNRLDFTIENLSNTVENATTARSRIEDTDYASESANLSRAQVLQQASQTMLAQANSAPQQVLSLLQ